MKIKGPTNGAPPVDGISPTDEVGEVGEVAETAPLDSVNGPAATNGSAASDAISRVAGQLRSGQITVDQAVERLIDDAVQRQLGQGHQAKELEGKLRELLRSYAETDPFLAARIRRLTHAK